MDALSLAFGHEISLAKAISNAAKAMFSKVHHRPNATSPNGNDMGYTCTIPTMTQPIENRYKLTLNRCLLVKGIVMEDKMGLN